jgi:hypothetical protein
MRALAPFLVLLAVCVGITALGFLMGQVDDKNLLLALSVVAVYGLCRWDNEDLRKQVARLERQLADMQRVSDDPTGGLSELGDLRNPSPEQVARALGESERT